MQAERWQLSGGTKQRETTLLVLSFLLPPSGRADLPRPQHLNQPFRADGAAADDVEVRRRFDRPSVRHRFEICSPQSGVEEYAEREIPN